MTLTIRGRHLSLIVKTYMRGQYVLAARTEQGLVTTLRQHLRRDVEIPDVKACTLDFCGAPADIQAQLREIAAAEQRRELIMRFSVSVVESGVPAGLQRCLDDEDPYHFNCAACGGLGVVGLDVESFFASAAVQRELAAASAFVPRGIGDPTHVFVPNLGHHEPGLEVWTIADYREALKQRAENKPLAFARLEYIEVPEAVTAAMREHEAAVTAKKAQEEAKRAAERQLREDAQERKREAAKAWAARLVADYLRATA
jgi:hypothetical protein